MTLEDYLAPRRSRVVVVAHPDDEAMWFGGMMLRHPGDWTVWCCSIPRRDPERVLKFYGACERLGARAFVLPFTESDPRQPLNNLRFLDDALGGPSVIFTHNEAGEYGHQHHKDVHAYLKTRWPEKTLTTRFGMTAGRFAVELDDIEWAAKLHAIRAYDHVSPTDGEPKWTALLRVYQQQKGIDLRQESYDFV